eukprot:4900486-Alexandrium_andersonii.AAC.1
MPCHTAVHNVTDRYTTWTQPLHAYGSLDLHTPKTMLGPFPLSIVSRLPVQPLPGLAQLIAELAHERALVGLRVQDVLAIVVGDGGWPTL